MKKLFLTFLITNTLFIGCAKEECYSCDSKIDAWVKGNATKLKKMNRGELSKLEISYQKAAMRMFSPKRKKRFGQINSVL